MQRSVQSVCLICHLTVLVCLVLCEDNGVNKWANVMGTCQHAMRQVTNCWTSTSCVNRCNGHWRGDYECQCDTDCIRRGDCCPDRDMACRATLPIKLEYWSTSTADCGALPDFDKLEQPSVEKTISKMRFESQEEEPNIFGISTSKAWAMRLTSYFFVRQKGTYKVFMLLGHRDTGIDLF